MLHSADGSAIVPMLPKLYVGGLFEAGAPLHLRIVSEAANHLGYLNAELEGCDFLIGKVVLVPMCSGRAWCGLRYATGAPGLSPNSPLVNTSEVRTTYQRTVGHSGA
jgi:glutathione S-transferase